MDIIVKFINLFIFLYLGSKAFDLLEPTKKVVNLIDIHGNMFLGSLQNQHVYHVLKKLRVLLFRISFLLIFIAILNILFFGTPSKIIYDTILPLSGFLLLTAFSIIWNLDHKETIKQFFIKSPMWLIPLAPLLIATFETFYGITLISDKEVVVTAMHHYNIGFWTYSVFMSIVLFSFYFIFPYILFWIILFPIFYIQVLGIQAVQRFIHIINKYISENVFGIILLFVGAILNFIF